MPLMMAYPARFQFGQRFTEPVQLIDVMPTILEMARIDTTPLLLHGQSLLPLLRREKPDVWARRVVASEEVSRRRSPEEGSWGSLFYRDWHMLYTKRHDPVVFNFVLDPAENHSHTGGVAQGLSRSNIIEYMETAQGLKIGVWQALTKGHTETVDYDPEVVEQLRELGYVD